MSLKTLIKNFPRFYSGMVSDVPHTEIPDDAVFYAENVVFTRDGNISNRGPIYDSFTSGTPNRPANGGAYESIGYANTPEQNATSATYISPTEWPTGVVVLPWTGDSKNGGTSTRILFETFNATPRSGLYTTISTWDSEYSDFEDNAVSTTIPIGIVPGESVGKSFDYFGNAGFPVGTQPFPVQENYDFSEYEQVGQTGVVVYSGYPNGGDNTVAPEYGYYLVSGTAVITAGSSALTLTTPSWGPTLADSSYLVGKWIYITDGTNEYLGRVVRSKNSTNYEISPTPTKSITDDGASANHMTRVSNYVCPWGWGIETGGGAIPTYAASGCVHQQRIVLACTEPHKYSSVEAYTNRTNIGNAFYYGMLTQVDSSQFPVKNRVNTICWSALRDDTATAAVSTVDGEIPLLRGGWPKSQYITLDTLGISAIVSIDANNLLVLCIDKVFLISGELGTILPNNNISQSSFNVRLLTSSYTCWSDATVQVTPYGVFFADNKGIYLTDGAKFVSVLQNRSRDFWQEFCQKATFAGETAEVDINGVTEPVSIVAPTGSAFINGSYFIWFGAVQGGEGTTTIVTPTKYGFQVQADANFAFSIVTTELTYNERYPSFGYSIEIPDTGKILTHSITSNRGLDNVRMDVPNLDKLRNPTIDPFDCTTGVTGGLGIYSEVITKAISFSNGVNARLRKSLVSYIAKAGTYPTNSGGIEITTSTNYIDRWSWNVSGYNMDQTIAPTTYVAPIIEDSQVRIDYVPNNLPDNAATSTNPNISSSFYMKFVSRGNNFTIRDFTLLYNEMRIGKLNR